MSKGKDLTKIVERLEALEERLGVSIEAVYAVYTENGSLIVNYDLHSRDGGQLSTNISIKLAVYDGAGRLIHEEGRWHGEEEFFGLESQHFEIQMDGPDIANIRLYPIAD